MLDAAYDRLRDEHRGAQIARTEAVRVGVAAALNRKAASAWQRAVARDRSPSQKLSGAALEQAVARIAQQFPENVVRATA